MAGQDKSQASRREEARAQVAAMREAQAKKEKRTRNITIGALIVVVLALVGVFLAVWIPQTHKDDLGKEVPSAATDKGGYPIGASGKVGTDNGPDAVEVTTFVDYMCPGCGMFETQVGPTLNELLKSKDITLVLHPVSILDRLSQNTQYSTRGAAAAALIADEAPDKLLAFNTQMFAKQPEENSSGLSNEEIADVAKKAGVSADVANKIAKGEATQQFGGWVQDQTKKVTDDKTNWHEGAESFSTPTILINGKVYEEPNILDPEALKKAVADAKG